MAFQYDINKIFAELEQQAQNNKGQHDKADEKKENNPIESPEYAKPTQKVAPATSKTTEDTHGGDEASKEIKDSPNSVDGGENPDKENKSEKTENTGEQGQGNGKGEKEEEKVETDEDGGNNGNGEGIGDKQDTEKEDKKSREKDAEEQEDYFTTAAGKNPSKNRPKTTPEDLKKAVEELFEKKKEKQDDFKTQNRQEYLKKYILEIIKKIAARTTNDREFKQNVPQQTITGLGIPFISFAIENFNADKITLNDLSNALGGIKIKHIRAIGQKLGGLYV